MTLDECTPGRRVWWQRSRAGGHVYRPVRIIRAGTVKVRVLTHLQSGPAWRNVRPEYLHPRLPKGHQP